MFANLKPNIPTKALPTCCIVLDIALAVFEEFTKSCGLKVFSTSVTNSDINFISSSSNNSFKRDLFLCFKVL